jgi:hypothetical protein
MAAFTHHSSLRCLPALRNNELLSAFPSLALPQSNVECVGCVPDNDERLTESTARAAGKSDD